MALFQSLANALKVLGVGHRVRVTLRPETGRFPNPVDGQITAKDEAGNMSVKSDQGIIEVRAEDILSITRMPG